MTHPSRTLSAPRPTRWLPAGILALALVLLQACGGGGGGGATPTVNQPPPATNANIAGAWIYTAPNGTVYRDLILPGTFEFRSLDSNMAAAVGVFTVTGNVLGGTLTAYPPAAYSAFYPILSGTISGTATDTAIHCTDTFSLGVFTADLAPDPAAPATAQLTDLAGTYSADSTHTSSGLGGTLTVNAEGTFTLTDSAGSGTGTLTPVATGLNAFRVALTVTPTGGSAAAYSGLCYLLTGTPNQIVFMTNISTGELSGIFSKQAS